jgi:hypothetical protein
MTNVEIRLLARGDLAILERVADDVFDHGIDMALAAEFLSDSRHHLMVAIDGDLVVGFVTPVHCREAWVVTNRSNSSRSRFTSPSGGQDVWSGCASAWPPASRSAPR